MNEEILTNAKFYIFQYGEKIAESIGYATRNIETYKGYIKASPTTGKNDKPDWQDHWEEKINDSKEHIENWQRMLDKMDECVKYLDTLIKK